ncbi:hypothetical protein Tco_1185223 [Tanacetum coccineum]
MGGSYYPIPCSILSTGKNRKTPQRYPDVPTTSWRIFIRSMDSFQGLLPKSPSSWHRPLAPTEESWALLEDLALYDNESWNDPRDFAKPVKAIALPQDVLSTSDRRLIELENQVQLLMEAHFAPTQPTQVNKFTTSCEICSGPHDTQYCMENTEQAFVEYASSRTDEARGLVSNFMASQDARLSKFEADFKRQQGEMTNKIDTVLKAITDQIACTLPSDTKPNKLENDKSEEKEHGKEGSPEDTNTMIHNDEKGDTSQLELKGATTDNLRPDKNEDEIEWLDVEESLDLVDTSEESVYESLIKEMPKCSLNYDFMIKKRVTQETLRFPA